jgi:hypothetical protein
MRSHSDLRSKTESSTWDPYGGDRWLGKTSISGRYENPVKGPSVVVQNENGERQVLEVTKTMKQAQAIAIAIAIEKDFKVLNTVQWCER